MIHTRSALALAAGAALAGGLALPAAAQAVHDTLADDLAGLVELARALVADGYTAARVGWGGGGQADQSGAELGEQPELKRVMGPGLLLLFVVGDILGTGVYALTGQVAKQVGGVRLSASNLS